jgi:pyrroloquinoline quinone biosynthesis protein B
VRIKVLGSAAGGGLPQWNCSCANCAAARAPKLGFRVRPRTQTQVAISGDNRTWTLLNCSPDLRSQIEATPELHSQPVNKFRQSPITGAVITSADVDCIFGLLHLREQQPLDIYSTAAVRDIIRNENSIFEMLEQTPEQTNWTEFKPGARIELASQSGIGSIGCHTFTTGSDLPYYAGKGRKSSSANDGAVMGLVIERGNSKFAFVPGVREITHEITERLESCDLLLIDGTFWSDDELIRIQGRGRTAREMGHLPVSGATGSIERLRGLRRPRKIFIHMNNTNPMLNEESEEYRRVRDSGWEIAEDGMEFVLPHQISRATS